jgi:recombination protein RecA
MASITKTYGDKAIFKLDEMPAYDVVSSGSLSLDYAIGVGGIPVGRVTEICGPNNAGKTLLVLHIIDNFLKAYPDKVVGFFDMEQRLEKDWAANFITDMDRVIVIKPGSAEEGINLFRDMAESDLMSLAIWDSIGGSPTAAALEKDAHKQQFAGNSKIITTLAQFAATLAGKHDFAFIGINQVREDMSGYKQLITPGGVAWKHACSLRIHVRPAPKSEGEIELIETINGEKMLVGRKIFAKVVKSSVGIPGRVGSYWFYNVPCSKGFGIDRTEEVVRLSTLTGVVERRGGWLYHTSFPDGKFQGQKNFGDFLHANPEVTELLFKLTMAKMQSGTIDMSEIIPVDISDEADTNDESPRTVSTMADIAARALAARAEA